MSLPSHTAPKRATGTTRLIRIVVGTGSALALLTALYLGAARLYSEARVQAAQQAPVVTGVTRVTMTDFTFSPPNIRVVKGATVTWVNKDTAPHNIVFDNNMAQSAILPTHRGIYSYALLTPGTYTYHCGLHPEMVGKVIVTG
ncbi:MAG TPA: cupredoxin domain-containing protein [Ktedonobacterales bacterium]